jgi:Putative Actinobacterial Holin-X, holin superfamily III
MEDNAKLIESLLERAVEYGKTSFELAKLKALDKTSDVISTLIPQTIILVLVASFILFLNLGLAFWLGEILGKTYFGFFVVGAFYGVIAIILRLFMYKWLKKHFCNYIIKEVLK